MSPPPAGSRGPVGAALWAPLAWVIAAFVVSRLLFRAAGIAFQTEQLGWFWQIIDPSLLRHDLAESLFHLHSQPPLFNLFLGVLLKVFPGHEGAAFAMAFLGIGLALHVSLFLLMTRLGVGARTSALLTIAFLASPAAILYENSLLYAHPAAAAICLAALFLHRAVALESTAAAFAFFCSIACIALLMSFFHIVWCAGALALVLASTRREWRQRACLAALPLALVVALYAKNWVLFGEPSASTWFGMNLAKITLDRLPPSDREDLFRSGAVSRLAWVTPFAPLSMYPEKWTQTAPRGIPVLDAPLKSTGEQNYNHAAYIRISRQYARDALATIRKRPVAYLRNVGLALLVYALPASDLFYVDSNRDRIAGVERVYALVPSGAVGTLLGKASPRAALVDGDYLVRHAGYAWMIALVLAVFFGLRRAARLRAQREDGAADAAVLFFLAFNVLYVTMVSCLFELGENNRFRYMIDPLVLALAASALAARLGRPRTRP